MAGLDTNVLVRWLVDDDAAQSACVATRLRRAIADGERLFVPVTVMLELEWVLRSRYGFGRTDILATLNALLETRELVFESEDAVERALHACRLGRADFADALHASLCAVAGHAPLLSFDRRAARLAEVELLTAP